MKVQEAILDGVLELLSEPHRDFRGFLVRTYEEEVLAAQNISCHWVQESLSHTARAHTIRGLHVQLSPHTEAKLITPIRGVARWVVVDLRKGSATFAQWRSVLLASEHFKSLYVDRGFAHGCVSLTDECDLLIKSDQKFGASLNTGIIWNDPDLNIDWGIGNDRPALSERDRAYPSFQQFLENFGSI